MKTESDLRRLAKYAKYNASEKGRARVERYRATPSIIRNDGLVLERRGSRNRWTSYLRRLDKRAAASERALQEMIDTYNAKHGAAPQKPVTLDWRAFGRRAIDAVRSQ